jgi:catechol 2,3-dioxygenase-like lactoylglutathione lyase family enzyme
VRKFATSYVPEPGGPGPFYLGLGFTPTGAIDEGEVVLAYPQLHGAGAREGEGEPEMNAIPTGTERARPFLPTQDFDRSKRFYEALGFAKVLDGEVAIFNAGSGGFILQRGYQKDWAENTMMQLMVDDLDAWWAHLQGLDLAARFGVQPPKPPAMQPWGLRVAYVYDPCGVLWHMSQRREDAVQDR